MAKEHYEYIPCDPIIPCKYREEDECFEDLHHQAYPKSDYKSGLSKKFRDNIMNKIMMCRALHDDEHAQNLPPKKPTTDEMKRFLGEQL